MQKSSSSNPAVFPRLFGDRRDEQEEMTGGQMRRTEHSTQPAEFVCWQEELDIKATPEEKVVGTVRVQTYVTEEKISKTVPLEHEEFRIIREKLSDADAARLTPHQIGEAMSEVHLHAQEAVVSVSKRMVPTERLRLEVRRVAEQVTVTETCRQEHFKIEEPNIKVMPAENRIHRIAEDIRNDLRR